MLQNDPWADFEEVQPAARAPAPAPSGDFTGFIPGVATPKTPPAQTADQAELDRLAVIRRKQEIAAAQEKAELGEAGLKAQEAERTAAFLTTRLAGSMAEIAAAAKKNPSAQSPSVLNEGVRATLGQTAANYLTGPERQQIEGAQLNALDAALTLGTGAAYTKEQLAGYYQSYFPQLGDTEDNVKAKQRRFRLLIEAAKLKAGTQAPKIDEALASVGIEDNSTFEEKIEDALTLPGLSPQDRLGIANRLAAGENRPINQDDAKKAAETGTADVVTEPGILEYAKQAGKSLLNVGAGIGEGLVALPDMAAEGAGYLMSLPFQAADALGIESAGPIADQLRNPLQIGEEIERIVPVPQNRNDWWARQAARVEGGVLGFPQRAGNALAEYVVGKVPTPPPGGSNALSTVANPQLADDLARLKIEPTMAATGGTTSKILTSGVGSTLGGASPIVSGAQRMVEGGKNALATIAGREGDVLTREAAGETATTAALKYRDISRMKAGELYDEAAKVAGDVRIKPNRATAEIDRNLAEFAETPMSADDAKYLQELRAELNERFPDGITVQGLRGLRTRLRDKFFKEGLRGSDVERRVGDVVETISEDITQTLIEQGKGRAAELYKAADSAWKTRVDTLDNFIMPIIGKRGERTGEEVVSALEAAMKGKGKKFDRFIRALPANEAGDVRATLIQALGKAKKGAQNAESSVFSFDELLTNWNAIQSDTAKRALFAEGDRAAMDSLARVSARVKDAQKFENWSRTGSNLLTGATGAALWTNPVATMLLVGASNVAGRVLASPGAARLLLRVTNAKQPGQAKEAIKEMSKLAARNPAAANDILDLQASLYRALGSPASSAAAEEQE